MCKIKNNSEKKRMPTFKNLKYNLHALLACCVLLSPQWSYDIYNWMIQFGGKFKQKYTFYIATLSLNCTDSARLSAETDNNYFSVNTDYIFIQSTVSCLRFEIVISTGYL
jgi:hypothetical protein